MTEPVPPNDDVLVGGDDSGWDDDVWGDEASPPDKRTVLFVQIGLVLLIVAIVAAVVLFKDDDESTDATGPTSTVAGAPAPGVAPGAAEPKPMVWPVEVGGRPPAFGALEGSPSEAPGGASPGVYIWTDYDGWHLWVVNGEGMAGLTGAITGDDVIASAVETPAGAGEVTVLDKVITFDLADDEPIVGVDFNPGFYANRLEFSLNGPGGPIPAALVHLGANGIPTVEPYVIQKAPAP